MLSERPLVARESDQASSPSSRRVRTAEFAPKRSVLLVDDEKEALDSLRRVLGEHSYRIFTATSATTALDVLSRETIDLVISDESMPGMKGTELLAKIATEYPETTRIMLTGYANVAVAKSAINQGGVFRLLEKPCDATRLRSAVEAALERNGASSSSSSGKSTPRSRRELDVLSDREREVVGLLLRGPRIAQVAKRLCISEHTVRNHLKAVFRKLNIHSQSELVERYGDCL